MEFLNAFWAALSFQGGYNTSLVLIGASVLGAGAGAIGVFLLLRRRALVSDAISHATLPGIMLASITGFLILGDGRALWLILTGAAASAASGIFAVEWIARKTRLPEDTAIATVLSTFFALGVVLQTIIQSSNLPGQAGLSDLIIGSTAGLLRADALLIVITASLVCLVLVFKIKPLSVLCFDPAFAQASGFDRRRLDRLLLVLLVAIVVIGLKTTGVVLVIALVVLPSAAARFWTERVNSMVLIAVLIGALGSYIGVALSAIWEGLPAGGIIVLTLAGFFGLSMLFAPARGVLGSVLKHYAFQLKIRERLGLLALSRGDPLHDRRTSQLMIKRGFLTKNGVLTGKGKAQSDKIAHDEALWTAYRTAYPNEARTIEGGSLCLIHDVLPSDLIATLEVDPVIKNGSSV